MPLPKLAPIAASPAVGYRSLGGDDDDEKPAPAAPGLALNLSLSAGAKLVAPDVASSGSAQQDSGASSMMLADDTVELCDHLVACAGKEVVVGPQNGRSNCLGPMGRTSLTEPPPGPHCREVRARSRARPLNAAEGSSPRGALLDAVDRS